jgi:magnesium transporter
VVEARGSAREQDMEVSVAARAYQVAEDRRLTPLAPEMVAATCRDPDAVVWLDLHAVNDEELAQHLDALQILGFSRRIVLEASERRGLYPLKNELALILPTPPKGSDHASASFITYVCRDNLLLTIHASELYQDEATIADSHNWLPACNASALLASAVFQLSQVTLRRTAELRRTILAIEDRMERDPESVSADELVAVRPDLAALSAVVADQVPALEALAAMAKPYFKLGDAQDLVQCGLSSVHACERTGAGLEQRLVGLRAAYQMHAQNRANSRLNMLTVLSSIFMPLTLLAGIWGMNFKGMPELDMPHGYGLALSSMALLAWGMFIVFRRLGWFD